MMQSSLSSWEAAFFKVEVKNLNENFTKCWFSAVCFFFLVFCNPLLTNQLKSARKFEINEWIVDLTIGKK